MPESADLPRPAYDDPATVEAASWLAQLDVDTVDRAAAVARFVAEVDAERAADSWPPLEQVAADDTTVVDEASDELEWHAVDSYVGQQLSAHLRDAGLDPDSVVLSSVQRCD